MWKARTPKCARLPSATYRETADVVTVALFRDGRMRDVFYGSAGWHSDFDFHEDD
jgi:hypothetical protein